MMKSPMMKSSMKNTLYYIHDPMCSWCWGFRPTWDALKRQLLEAFPDVIIHNVIGGLAPDSDEPMPLGMQKMLQSTWQRIQRAIPNTQFNYDFWQTGEPRRSTYPACRAVIAAAQQDLAGNVIESDANENAMILAIQQAYYLHAKNPSNNDTLIACAETAGLDTAQFTQDLNSENTQQLLRQNMAEYQRLAQLSGVSGFPSLVLQHAGQSEARYSSIAIDYNNPQAIFDTIQQSISLG
jgi:putative protein-disulfide isomerase